MTHQAFNKIDHRPWALPSRSWKWRQTWCDLLFAHWPIPTAELKPYVPRPLKIQEYAGTSWVGIIPFRMEGVMHRPFPDLPWISSFPEINVRLYVEYEDKPGVWFLSLDASNSLAVWAARRFFYLPYYRAEINIENCGRRCHYKSHRKGKKPAAFQGIYEPDSEPYEAESGSLEHWLTERYCLYAQSPKGGVYRSEVHHLPWPLQKAKAEFITNKMLNSFNITLPAESPLLHYAERLNVVIWPPEKIEA